MAKKPRSGRPQPGGRVTPKGSRPAGSHRSADGASSHDDVPRPQRIDPTHRFAAPGAHVPLRAGHNRGQR